MSRKSRRYSKAEMPGDEESFVEYVDQELDKIENAMLSQIADTWFEVGDTGEVQFQNSWANSGITDTESLAFRLHGEDHLELKGNIDSGTTTDGTVIFTLPEEFRPAKIISIPAIQHLTTGGHSSLAEIEININGDVKIYNLSVSFQDLVFHAIVNINNG